MPLPRITAIHRYPIKSCGGESLQVAPIADTGIEYDRTHVLVDADNIPLTARKHPQLARVAVRIVSDEMIVSEPSHGELAVPLNEPGIGLVEPVTLFEKPGTGQAFSEDANLFFSTYLGESVRLLRAVESRTIKPETHVRAEGARNITAFADGYPFLLTSQSSLDELNATIQELGGTPVGMERFRPNFTVDTFYSEAGEPVPYEEDNARNMRIGDTLHAFGVRACSRCVMVDVDHEIGVLPTAQTNYVTKALQKTRRGIDAVNDKPGKFFGQNLVHLYWEGRKVNLGDEITTYVRSSEPNVRQV